MARFTAETVVKPLLGFLALLSLVFLAGILVTLLTESGPFFGEYNPIEFFTGTQWYPTLETQNAAGDWVSNPRFGLLPLLTASLQVTLLALAIALPLSLGAAIFLAEIAPPVLREIVKPLIELLAGIPSVVFGFIGMVLVAPFIKDLFAIPIGLNGLSASIVLAFMAFPTITSLAEDAICAVPRDLKEASLAMGANRWETTSRVMLPAARSGIYSAVILGFGRVIGETMTVLMVAGGGAALTLNPLSPLRPMTATIALEMGEAVQGGPHYHALFALALLLLVITLAFNLLAERIRGRQQEMFK
jgi:phosphate transport system permease protein